MEFKIVIFNKFQYSLTYTMMPTPKIMPSNNSIFNKSIYCSA